MSNFKMPKGSNKTENNYDYQFILTKEEIENNKQEMKAELKDIKETLKTFTEFMMDQINISKSSPD